jgi:hypothetical protein
VIRRIAEIAKRACDDRRYGRLTREFQVQIVVRRLGSDRDRASAER